MTITGGEGLSVTRFVRENFVILAMWTAQIVAGSVALAVGYNTTLNRISNIEQRITELEGAKPTETKWRLDRIEADATAARVVQAAQQQTTANISSELKLLNQKVDFLVETQKSRNAASSE